MTCDNEYCETELSEVTNKVPVSEHDYGDASRHLCAVCTRAYTIGVEHAAFRDKDRLQRIEHMADEASHCEDYQTYDDVLSEIAAITQAKEVPAEAQSN